VGVAGAQESANLLRNADFQDDWLTLLPENQTLHWSYLPTFPTARLQPRRLVAAR